MDQTAPPSTPPDRAGSGESDPAEAERAIRTYLLYVEEPGKLRDEADIQRKTRAVLDADDPIDKLKALAELERAAHVDEAPLRAAFVRHAKAWADDNAIHAGAFRELGVADDVLREAGFTLPSGPPRRRSAVAPAGTGRPRAKAVPVEQIRSHVLDRQGTFVLADVMEAAGGSPATVRKAVEELVEAGRVERLGPVADHAGPGRAPVQYRRT